MASSEDKKKEEIKAERKDDKKEERRFATLTAQSVATIAEAVDLSNLSPDISRLLAEDASYRLRSLLQDAIHIMKHARRKRLKVQDLNKALSQMDVLPIHGHDSPVITEWKSVRDPISKDAELSYVEDPEIDLVQVSNDNQLPLDLGVTSVKANWLVVEGSQQTSGFTSTSVRPPRLLNDELLRYYDKVTAAIVGDDITLCQRALSDLRRSSRISALVPHLVQFVATQLGLEHQLTAQRKLLTLLQALLQNPNLFLRPLPIAAKICESAMHCVLEESSDPDHWLLRDQAAMVLATTCRLWGEDGVRDNQVGHLSQVIEGNSCHLAALYGAVTTLSYMGVPVVEQVLLPRLGTCWDHVTMHMKQSSHLGSQSDAMYCRTALLEACGLVLRYHSSGIEERQGADISTCIFVNFKPDNVKVKSEESSICQVSSSDKLDNRKESIKELYRHIYEIMGDSLLSVSQSKMGLDTIFVSRDFRPEAEVSVCLGDADSHRTGEEMLQEFLDVQSEPKIKQEDVGRDEDNSGGATSQQSKATKSGKRSRHESGTSKTKRRRSSGKPRLNDVFDLPTRRKSSSSISFSAFGRMEDLLRQGHKVGRKIKTGTVTSGKIKAPIPISMYRNLSLKLPPVGKRRMRTKQYRPSVNTSLLL